MGWRYLLGWFIFGLGIGANAMHSRRDGSFCESCPSGWTWFGDRCYTYVSIKKTWADAEKYCNSLDGNLASLTTPSIYAFVEALILAVTGSNTECWAGGNDAVESQRWFWVSGEASGFEGWCAGEPDNHNGDERCLALNTNGKDCAGDEKCSKTKPFVCTKDCTCPR